MKTGIKKYSLLLILVLFYLNSFSQKTTPVVDITQKIIAGRKNSAEQQKKPYVILISADGFRWDYADKYNAENRFVSLSLGPGKQHFF
jgi:hypothetical protein